MNKDLLDIYTDYLICQNKYATATGLSSLLDGQISHDKITRFLNTEKLDSRDLWNFVKKDLRCIEEDRGGVLILDDAIEEKPYTDENEIVCWHFSHAKGRCVKGINILSCLARYGDKDLPIAFEAVHKELYYCDTKTKKEIRRSTKTKNEQLRSIVQQAVTNQVKFDYILADNWFGAKKNMDFIHFNLKKKFIFGIKSNRLVKISNIEKKGQFQKLNSIELRNGETIQAYLKNMSFPVTILKKIFKNEDKSIGTLYLVTNDLNVDPGQLYEVYQKRWRIEEYHKSIKQNTSLSKSPTKVIRSQKNHIFASIISYCKLEFLRWKNHLNHFAMKYKLILKANQATFKEFQEIKKIASRA